MKHLEYRIEEIPLDEHGQMPPLVLVTERLNELGGEGWEVASIDLTPHPSYSPAAQPKAPIAVLLEREVA
jgi:hypothetical protein